MVPIKLDCFIEVKDVSIHFERGLGGRVQATVRFYRGERGRPLRTYTSNDDMLLSFPGSGKLIEAVQKLVEDQIVGQLLQQQERDREVENETE